MKRLLTLFVITLLVFSCKKEPKNNKISGQIFGTSYTIQYDSSTNFQKQFDSLFYIINKSMSTYQANSDISKINRNESVEVNAHFKTVFDTSKDIFNKTNGVFDPTIGGVVNAWDFGPEGKIKNLDSLKIDSLMTGVGFNKVKLINNIIIKQNRNTFLDFNAIAKGYAVDVISDFLESQNIDNYFVFIGGELRVKGRNIEKNKPWRVGIQNPDFEGNESYDKEISLKNQAMATSGTYRKFKIDENGNRYAHIINTKTGYPSKTNILSVSVIAENCMTADGYATAFQAMGIENVKTFLTAHKNLKVFLIFENENRELETLSLNDFPKN